MAYGIAFDMNINCYKDYIKELHNDLKKNEDENKEKSHLASVYREIEEGMSRAGFIHLQGNIYRSNKDSIDAIDELSVIKGFHDCVKSVHGFRMDGWSDLKKRLN